MRPWWRSAIVSYQRSNPVEGVAQGREEEEMVPMRRMAMLVTVALAMMALGTGVAPAASAQASIDPQAPIADPPLPPGYNPCWPVATEPWCNDGGGTQVGILL